jgi:hypothetical protein
LAINGNYSLSDYKKALSAQGTVVIVGGSLSQLLKSLLFGKLLFLGKKRLLNLSAKPSKTDLKLILHLVELMVVTPVIDSAFNSIRPLKQSDIFKKVMLKARSLSSNNMKSNQIFKSLNPSQRDFCLSFLGV